MNFRSFGTIVLIALPVLAIIGVLAPMALGMESLSLLSIYLVIPMFLASFVYWKYFRDI